MAQLINEVMTKKVHSVRSDAPLHDVARMMRDKQIGDVLVTDRDGKLRGILTDRDIVVRAIAADRDLAATKAGDICTDSVTNVAPNATVEEAVKLMRERAVRRVPVVRDGVPIGIVSIGDLARERDPGSALAAISAAAPNG
jgi:CBS domain-containing protein